LVTSCLCGNEKQRTTKYDIQYSMFFFRREKLERIPITKEGYEALKKELEYLKKVERPANIKSIEEARAHGDLSENAEFAAAKDRQAYLQCRIGELMYKLGNADVIDPDSLSKDRGYSGAR